MRTSLVVLFVGLCALAIANPVQKKDNYKVADKAYLEKQRDIYRLFQYVNQPAYYKDFVEIAQSFKLEECFDLFTKPQYAKEFYRYYKHDILPKGEIFSVFNQDHLKQAIALFRTLYYAKDYETFYKTAVWARQHVNEGMFVYALSVAVIHGQFTREIILPPIYEIFPEYFFSSEVIYKAKQYKQHYFNYDHEEVVKDDFKGYTIPANYSGFYMNVHPEQSMSYFTEDVGLNAYYYYTHIFSPFWMDNEEINFDSAHRGEYYYYYTQQILARYYLERLANGKGEIPHFNYDHPIETGYYPSLTYPNGLHFPTRPSHAHLYYHGVHGKQSYPAFGNYSYSYTYVKDYERRIRDALERGFVYTPEGKLLQLYTKDGFKTLANMIESNPASPHRRFFGNLQMYARRLLGYSYFPLDEYKLAPSALEHFETSLRDPMFYQMYKRILAFFYQYQNYMGPYEKNELKFDGIKVTDIVFPERLVTFFDYYYSDLSNAVVVDEKEFNEDSFGVRARQYRLNHRPFHYNIHVTSDKETEAFVKVFIGPKYDEYGREIDMKENYMNFFEIDRFRYTLKSGQNTIERSSRDSTHFSRDRTTFQKTYKQVLTALNGGETFKYYPRNNYYTIPRRLMLPKGDVGGKTYQFYVIISKYHAPSSPNHVKNYFVDVSYSIGYPFDRPIENEHDFFVPNSHIEDIVIYHKKGEHSEEH